MTDVKTAERTLADLQTKRGVLVAHGVELEELRRPIAYSAHTGDGKARKKLDELNAEAVRFDSELKSLDVAIAEANTRLQAARREADIAADQQQARDLRNALGTFIEHGRALDAAMTALVAECSRLKDTLTKLQRLGAGVPTHDQVDALGHLALLTALGQTLWRRRFEPLAPNQRRTFSLLFDGWAVTVERDIAARLGEAEVEEAA